VKFSLVFDHLYQKNIFKKTIPKNILKRIVGRTANDEVEEAALVGRVKGPGDQDVYGGDVLLGGEDEDPGERVHQHPLQVPSDPIQRHRAVPTTAKQTIIDQSSHEFVKIIKT